MLRCEACTGNHAKKSYLTVARTRTFSNYDFAIPCCMPTCPYCGCTIRSYSVEAGDDYYCCTHCAQSASEEGLHRRIGQEK